MNTDATPTPDTITLRAALVKPLPTYTDEFHRDADGHYQPDPGYLELEHLIQELLRWSCLVMAHNAYHTSDSEIDSCNALVITIQNMHNINYGHDLSESLQASIDIWLDSEGSWMDLQMTSDPNFTTPADLPAPAIFSYFNLDYDHFDRLYTD